MISEAPSTPSDALAVKSEKLFVASDALFVQKPRPRVRKMEIVSRKWKGRAYSGRKGRARRSARAEDRRQPCEFADDLLRHEQTDPCRGSTPARAERRALPGLDCTPRNLGTNCPVGSSHFENPNGISSLSPGLRSRRYPGKSFIKEPATLKGLRHSWPRNVAR